MDNISIVNILIAFGIGCLIGWPIGKLVAPIMLDRIERRANSRSSKNDGGSSSVFSRYRR